MTSSEFYLPRYDWQIKILFDVFPEDSEEMLYYLNQVHPKPRNRESALRMVKSGRLNFGFTQSCLSCHKTLIAIGPATSRSEFLNSVEHEVRHLVDDISEVYHLDERGEEVGYLTGEINRLLTQDVQAYICPCNLKRN